MSLPNGLCVSTTQTRSLSLLLNYWKHLNSFYPCLW